MASIKRCNQLTYYTSHTFSSPQKITAHTTRGRTNRSARACGTEWASKSVLIINTNSPSKWLFMEFHMVGVVDAFWHLSLQLKNKYITDRGRHWYLIKWFERKHIGHSFSVISVQARKLRLCWMCSYQRIVLRKIFISNARKYLDIFCHLNLLTKNVLLDKEFDKNSTFFVGRFSWQKISWYFPTSEINIRLTTILWFIQQCPSDDYVWLGFATHDRS